MVCAQCADSLRAAVALLGAERTLDRLLGKVVIAAKPSVRYEPRAGDDWLVVDHKVRLSHRASCGEPSRSAGERGRALCAL